MSYYPERLMQNFRVYKYITLCLFTELGFLSCMPNHIEAFNMLDNNQGLQPCKFKGEKMYKRGIRQNKITRKAGKIHCRWENKGKY